MGIEEVKIDIKHKFGSLTKFALLAKMDRYDLQKFFAAAGKNMTPERQKHLDALAKLARATKVKALPTELDESLRKKIAKAIDEFGGVEYFCQENTKFNATSVRHIINGTRKRVNARVNALLTILKIDNNGGSKTDTETTAR